MARSLGTPIDGVRLDAAAAIYPELDLSGRFLGSPWRCALSGRLGARLGHSRAGRIADCEPPLRKVGTGSAAVAAQIVAKEHGRPRTLGDLASTHHAAEARLAEIDNQKLNPRQGPACIRPWIGAGRAGWSEDRHPI